MTVPPSGLKAGLQARQRLDRGIGARVLVAIDDERLALPLRDRDRDELVGEPAGLDGGDGALLALERELVLALARDAPALGDVLGGLAHRVRVVALGQARVDEPPAERRVGHLAGAAVVGRFGLELDVRRPGHRFDAAADEHVAIADGDRVRGRVDRLEARPAQPVDGQPADLDREIGQEERHPRDVAVVLAGLVGAAEDDVLDECRVDAGTVDEPAQDRGGQVVGPDAGQGAAVATDRGPDRLDDPGFTKGTVESRVMG